MDNSTPPIGELLVQWQLVSEKDRNAALTDARKLSLPLGLALRLHGAVDLELLHNAVTAQALLRDSVILPQHAREAMAVVIRKRIQFNLALDLLGIEVGSKKRCRLGELLIESETLNRELLKSHLACAKATGLPLGRVVCNLADVPKDVIDMALKVQAQVRAGTMSREEAINQLYSARRSNAVISNVSHSLMEQRTQLGQLLSMAGLISEKDVEYALIMSSAEGKFLGEALTSLSLIKPYEVHAALEVQHMIRSNKISFNQGLNQLKKLLSNKEDEDRTGTLHQMPAMEKSTVTFSSFLKLINCIPKSDGRKNQTDEQRPELDAQLDEAWQELRTNFFFAAPPDDRIHPNVKEILQRSGFLTDKQMTSVQRAAMAYRFFRDDRLTIEQALIQYHRMQVEDSNPSTWQTAFPQLNV
ncbi:MAG: hypothetical protein K2Y39_21860 [Candidatus Obscuribacterales bacterium]|nr:hypothetical protein [Candidatus Obscuribacterales bacterium]